MIAAVVVAVEVVVLAAPAGCTSGSPSALPRSRGSPTSSSSAIPIVTVVPQPFGGQAGRLVAVDGTVRWVVPGRPACAELDTRRQPPQILSLVGSTADHVRREADAGRHVGTEHALIIGYVPPAAATVCGGLTFSVMRISPAGP